MITTADVPFLKKEAPVAESKPAAKSEKTEKAEAPKLGRASESGDAGVQNLLAQRNGYEVNGMKDKVAEVDAALAELGYAVY